LQDLIITPLKRIAHPKGDIYHAMKSSDIGFVSFGEAYFSIISYDEIKGWKKHTQMVLNLVVPTGKVRFVIYDDRGDSNSFGEFFDVVLSSDNYSRITIPNGVWMAFEGVGKGLNMLLNIASIEHNPDESISCELSKISYSWQKNEKD